MEQRFWNTPLAFSILLGMTMFTYLGCIGAYSTGTITTLQQQFLFKSSEIGFLLAVNDVVAMVTVTLVAHYGVSRNRPRILGCLTFVFSAGCLVSTIPQWVEDSAYQNATIGSNSSSSKDLICDFTGVPDDGDKCSDKEKEESGAQHLKAIWLYIGQAFFGLASSGYLSLGISYLDDGILPKKAPIYIAGIFTVMSLGSFMAFGLSAFSLTFHADFYKINVDELGYGDKDPRWIGAWWLGYLVYAGLFIILGVPYFFFPKEWPTQLSTEDEGIELEINPKIKDDINSNRHDKECQTAVTGDDDEVGVVVKIAVDELNVQMNGSTEKQNGHHELVEGSNSYNRLDIESDDASKLTADEKENGDQGNKPTSLCSFALITGYLSAVRRLLTNFTFMAIVLGGTTASANSSGFYIFIGRYLQTAYDITPSDVSVILSAVSSPTSMFGFFLSGVIINRMNLKIKGLINLAVICKTIAVVFIAGNFAIFCSRALIAGVTAPYSTGEISLEPVPSCMASCGCEKGVYTPVCGSDGLTYITPCHAGCTGLTENNEGETVYTNCTCVSSSSTASPPFEGLSTAIKNQCPRSCRVKIITFICLYCVFSTVQSLMGNAVFIAKLRVVESRDKALSLGLSSFFSKVLALIPAPIYYGLVIQSTCAMFQESCGETGNCLIYDTDHFAKNFWGLFFGLGVTTIFCYVVSSISLRRDAKGEYLPLQLRIFQKRSEKEISKS